MAVIETLTFKLADDEDVNKFLEADRRVQWEAAAKCAGLLRRTTARGDNGEWIVVTLWRSTADAEAATAAADQPATDAFFALVDSSSVRTSRYLSLD
jgi:hypothetical protein